MTATSAPARTGGTEAELICRASQERRTARGLRVAALLVFGVIAGARVEGIGEHWSWSWLLLIAAGVVAGIFDIIADFRWRLRDMPPFRPVRRELSIVPDVGGFRATPRGRALLVDGVAVDLDGSSHIRVTRSGSGSRLRHQVNLVLAKEVVVVEALRTAAYASELAGKLAGAFDIAILDPEKEPAEQRRISENVELPLACIALATNACIVAIVWWSIWTDVPDRLGLPLALVALMAGAIFAAARRIRLRIVQLEALEIARLFFGLKDLGAKARRSSGDRVVALTAVGGIVIVMICAWRAGRPDLPPASADWFNHASPSVCRIDAAGADALEAVGLSSETNEGWTLAIIDPKTGKIFQDHARTRTWNFSQCQPPFLRFDEDHDSKGAAELNVSAWNVPRDEGNSLWKVTFEGELVEALRTRDCAVVHLKQSGAKEAWRSISLTSGGPCASVPEPVLPEAIVAVRREEAERLEHLQRLRHVSNGVEYALVDSGPDLMLSASYAGALLWSKSLPARSIAGSPFAIAGGVVVVAGMDSRTGRHERIIGVDAETGEVRYVLPYTRRSGAKVTLTEAGSIVLIWSGRLAGLDARTGRVAWITHDD